MKKVLFMTALMIAAAFTLTSCGNDEPEVKTTATTTYIMTFSQDMLEAANLFVIYKAENGRNVMEAINSTWWTKRSPATSSLPSLAFAINSAPSLKLI